MNHLTNHDLSMAATVGGVGGWLASLMSHGLMGPLVSFLLFVITTAARSYMNRRHAPAALTPAQVGQLISELHKQGFIKGGREGVTPHQDPQQKRSEGEV